MSESMNKDEILKQYFGHSGFRHGQEELIENILSGRDVLGIMPTGAGKSICYQVPALMFSGITIVISPLISLMKDQVNSLIQVGIPAAFINSSLSQQEYSYIFEAAHKGKFKIIYVAPERLTTAEFINFAECANISMVTVDEAHCVSQWGQDFRPSYLRVVEFIEKLSHRPIVSAFTATATKEVRDDISLILGLENPFIITTGFDRENLYFEVQNPRDKYQALLEIVSRNAGKSGIVYCATRKNVEKVCDYLNQKNFLATRYHAGLSDVERHENQDDFIYDRKQIIVATNAFGMGIDKSNVSYVVHYNMPKNVESYYQEAGRAGRDGGKSECILLYSGQDARINQFLIDNDKDVNCDLSNEMRIIVKQKDRERLKTMTLYCTTTECLRAFILKYFGELSMSSCGNCSNCNTNFEVVDITIESQKIVSCVYRLRQRNQMFGKIMITDILRGSNNKKIKRWGLDTLSTYGIMADTPVRKIRSIIDYLIEDNYLMLTNDKFPVINPTDKSREIVKEREPISMKQAKSSKKNNAIESVSDYNIDNALFKKLKELRITLAREAHVPAYIIFSDASLRDMCRKLPTTKSEFNSVSGVGEKKATAYACAFTNIIKEHLEEKINIEKFSASSKPQVKTNCDKVISKEKTCSYQHWSEEEDLILENSFRLGMSIKDISEQHQRTSGAIRSRLKKLGLVDD